MTTWLLAVAAGLVAAGVQYGRGAMQPRTLPLALLRALAATLVIALLLSAPAGRAATERSEVALDASESWTRASDGSAWKAALDSVARQGGTVRQFGDSVRVASGGEPRDHASRVRDVVSSSGPEECLQKSGALVLQNAGGNFAPVIERGKLQQIHNTAGRAASFIWTTEDHPPHPHVH